MVEPENGIGKAELRRSKELPDFIFKRIERLEAESDYQQWILEASLGVLSQATVHDPDRGLRVEPNGYKALSRRIAPDWEVVLSQGSSIKKPHLMHLSLLGYDGIIDDEDSEVIFDETLAIIDQEARGVFPSNFDGAVIGPDDTRLSIEELGNLLELIKALDQPFSGDV